MVNTAKNIVMIGTGYVGLVTGACLADIGHNVLCIDKDAAKIDMLKSGGIPIYEPGLKEIVTRNAKSGNLKFSTELNLEKADAIFLGVGTPTDDTTGNADLTALFSAATEIKQKLKSKTIIVTKSTVPVGTGEKLKSIIGNLGEMVSNPEFLREGNAVNDFMNPDRIVIGSESAHANKIMAEIYAPLKSETLFTSIESAELIKYAANAFLAAKVAYINEIADLCEKVGADVEDVSRGMGLDKRIGSQFLKAGPGIGGSCFPKDIRALLAQEKSAGLESKMVEAVIDSNEKRKIRIAQKIADIVGQGTSASKIIAIWGLTFKANTDDMRESPSLTIIPELQKAGFKIRAYDPEGAREAKKLLPGIELCDTAENAAQGASAIVILTEWQEFKTIDFTKLKLKTKIMIDLRNLLERAQVADYDYYSTGRKPCLAENLVKTKAIA